jgi:predicted nucleic acid-binding protein
MSLSCLVDPSIPIIADTSTIINLNASGYAAKILTALPHKVAIIDTVLDELRIDPRNARDDAKMVSDLVAPGLLSVIGLATLQQGHFENLIAGPTAETLDDGEAATIACAIEFNAIPLIDERKAIAICARRYPKLIVARTTDVFTHQAVERALGRDALAESVYNALQDARMRVAPHHQQWVVQLIGQKRADLCQSLPSHLRRR